MSNIIRIVGIDPSLNNFGFAVAEVDIETLEIKIQSIKHACPIIEKKAAAKQVRKNCDDIRRASWLRKQLLLAIDGADFVSVEMPVGSQSARAMASYGMVIGVLTSCTVPMIQVSAAEVKINGAGHKTASKEEMMNWAYNKYPHLNWNTRELKGKKVLNANNEHCADAIGALIAGVNSDQFKEMIAMFKVVASRRDASPTN